MTSLVLAAIAAGVALKSQSGLEYDSVSYLDLATNLAAGKGFVHRWAYWDPIYEAAQLPTATSMWPPGLSLAIAALHALGMSPDLAGRVIGVFAFTILSVALYVVARFIARPVQAFIAVVVALIPALPWVPLIVSEMPYLVAATIASLCAAEAIFARDRAMFWWLCASTAAGASFAFRYVGLANAFQICLVAWLFSRGQTLNMRVRRVALAGSVSGVVIASILFRNWIVSGHLGQSWPGAEIFWSTLLPSIKAAVAIELGGQQLWGSLVGLAVPAQVVALGVLLVISSRNILAACVQQKDEHDRQALSVTAIMMLMLVCTYGITIAATAAKGMDLDQRHLLAPVPWAILLLTAWCLHEAAPARRALFIPMFVALGVWLVFQSLLTVRVLSLPQESYVQAARTSDVVAWLREHVPPDETLLSNRGAELAYWLPNPVMRLPRLPYASPGTTTWDDVDRLAHKAGAHYLIHFRNYPEYAKYQQEEFDFLRALDNSSAFLERKPQVFTDAIVYRVGLNARSTSRLVTE